MGPLSVQGNTTEERFLMGMNVADALVEAAVRAGVLRVYGVIGDSLNPVGDAIRRNGGAAVGSCPP